jgi:hypothetical protein
VFILRHAYSTIPQRFPHYLSLWKNQPMASFPFPDWPYLGNPAPFLGIDIEKKKIYFVDSE